jgi:hypothetical protein
MNVAGDERYQLVFRPDGDLLERARGCEADVFLQTFGNTEQDFAEEYGAYEQASHFIALADPCGEVVGCCRLIVPSPAGLKTINDVSRPPWGVDGARAVRLLGADLSRAWDVATLAVRKDRPVPQLASAALYHGLVQAMRANGIRWIVMMLDERVRRLLAAAGVMLRPIPGTVPAPYLGSPATVPLFGDLPAMVDAQRRHHPDAYRLLGMGVGLGGIEVPPLAEWVIGAPTHAALHDGQPGLARTA